jgi:hemerythrin-like metal-binding protein
MAYFEWADDMVIDGGVIDEDHQKLVHLVNDLHTATTDGRGREVVEAILADLLAYTADHLRREESVMSSAGFPNLERHKIGHAHFIVQLNALRQKFDAGSITVAAQLSTVLRDWLSLHIRRSDREVRTYLEKLGQR